MSEETKEKMVKKDFHITDMNMMASRGDRGKNDDNKR